jgi:cytochrome d ubiquinol oxidase subunit II
VLTGRFEGAESTSWAATGRRRASNPRLVTRAAGACLIAGIGLLTLADAAWAHAIGVLCLLGFMVAAFLAIVPRALADQPERLPASLSGRPRR